MQRHHSYSMAYASPSPSPKYSSSHSTSSAFSASANANEDWTKISDLAERRRIQNRIAQRNYRKKIKRRLEDLEKRAGSSSSPEQSHAEIGPANDISPRRDSGVKRQKSKGESHISQTDTRTPEPLNAPYSLSNEVRSDLSPRQYKRELSLSPPPTFGYSYSLPDPMVHAPYPQHAAYNTLPAPFSDYPDQSHYLPPLPTTLPSMPSFEPSPIKSNNFFEEENMLNQYNMSYANFTSMELPMQQSYQDSNVHTPPLSHSHSFDQSRDGSPSLMYPDTPISIPDSPQFRHLG